MSGFWQTLFRGLSLFGAPFRSFQKDYPAEPEHPFAEDRKALRGDWQVVQGDLAAALKRVRQEASAASEDRGC